MRYETVIPLIYLSLSFLLSGNHSFDTTNNTTYQTISGDHRVKKILQKELTPLNKRGQFQGKTQTMSDFPGYSKGQPRPPKAIEPAPVTIDLKFNNKSVSRSRSNVVVYTQQKTIHT